MKQMISLDGLWRYTPELECRPETSFITSEVPIYADERLCRKDWELGVVPGVWNRYAEVYRLFEGVMWFCKEVTLADIRERTKAKICFKGVSYRADVYVNGVLAGTHESSYTEFTLDVTELVRNGNNLITVRVDNRAMLRKWPCDRGYFCYGGIHRSVYLELLEDGCIDTADVTPILDTNTGILHASGQLYCGGGKQIRLRLGSADVSACADENGYYDLTLSCPDITPWTPDAPVLYDAVLETDADVKQYQIGFKCFESRESKLWLNGKPYPLKGVCYVYDSPVYGLVMAGEQLEKDLGEMKAAGVNAIRLHYPMDDLFYDLCDRMGFLVWTELPIYCYHPNIQTENTYFKDPDHVANARQIAQEMVGAARSHVSVAFYSIGNECNVNHPEAAPFFRALAGFIRNLDNTRLISFAALYGLVATIGDVIDVIGLNSYYGWYDRISGLIEGRVQPETDGDYVRFNHPDLTPFHKMIHDVLPKLPSSLPILLTEFGADSIPGNHSPMADMWSEEYHAEVIRETIRASKQYDRILGTFVFCFTDNQDPSKPRNGYWNFQNLKGMLSYNRDRKLPYYAMKEEYSGN